MQHFEVDISPEKKDIPLDMAKLQQNQLGYDPQKIISVKNVHKTYLIGVEGVTALRGVTFDIKEGEFIMILGTSGGGKTTLLNIMGTIDKPTKGDLFICGQKIKSNTQDQFLASLRLTYLGFVFQTFNLISSLTAIQNVELPMTLRGELSKEAIRARALELLDQVGLKDRVNHFPNQLSGGEQQRVTICRALANRPQILFLDEPTGDLDTQNTDIVMKILLDLNKNEGITMVMVTHDVALQCFSNRVVRMIDGKINNIQVTNPELRSRNLEDLGQLVENHLSKNPIQMKLNALGVRAGAIGPNKEEKKGDDEEDKPNQDKSNSQTQIRKPGQYAVFQFAEKQKSHL